MLSVQSFVDEFVVRKTLDENCRKCHVKTICSSAYHPKFISITLALTNWSFFQTVWDGYPSLETPIHPVGNLQDLVRNFLDILIKEKEGQKNWAISQLHSQTCWFCIAESATTSIFNYCKCQWFKFSSHGNKRSISNGLYDFDFDLVLSLLVFVLLLLPTN